MNKVLREDLRRGFGTAERPRIGELWDRANQQSVAVQATGNYEPRHEQIDFTRYYNPDYFQRELQKVWSKTWLFACRDEDIPEVGDRVPFDVGPLSFFIVRTAPDAFKAYYNSCLHRGTKLCSKRESASTIRCPYHAWEWNNDGSLKRVPSHWDFTSVTKLNSSLREAAVGRWGGFIFINADPDPIPLEEALGPIPEHFRDFRTENRYTAARFRKLVPANWKIAQEAFMESYHVIGTHPAAIPYNGDSQAQYDIWTNAHGYVGRQSTPSAIPSVHAPPDATLLGAAEAYLWVMTSWHYPDAEQPALDLSKDLRSQLADWHRGVQEKLYKRKIDAPEAVMIDHMLYFQFPQFCVWLSESLPFTYQFTPHKTDPELSYFDVRMLMPYAEGAPRPPAVSAVEVGIDEKIADKAPDFGFLAQVFDEDMGNMPIVQAGVRAADPARHHSQLASYQEMILQHSHEMLDRYMGGGNQ